jgi:hypothetical protein
MPSQLLPHQTAATASSTLQLRSDRVCSPSVVEHLEVDTGMWNQGMMVQLMSSSSSSSGHVIQCDSSDAVEVHKGADKPVGYCGAGDVFGWSDSIARTVQG